MEKNPLDEKEWEKKLEKGQLIYKNIKEDYSLTSHPKINIFREAFHEIAKVNLEMSAAAGVVKKVEPLEANLYSGQKNSSRALFSIFFFFWNLKNLKQKIMNL